MLELNCDSLVRYPYCVRNLVHDTPSHFQHHSRVVVQLTAQFSADSQRGLALAIHLTTALNQVSLSSS